MKALINIVGIILIIVGIVSFAYRGIYTYNTREKVAEIGNVQITAENEKTIYFPPLLSGASIVVGVVLVAMGRVGRK